MKFLALILCVLAQNGLSFNFITSRYQRPSSSLRSTLDKDKVEVEQYFNNEGFNRWNKIYSESDEVNSVQLDIRNGHAITVNKVLNFFESEDNKKNTVCDAGSALKCTKISWIAFYSYLCNPFMF